jgi:hypothetical protein
MFEKEYIFKGEHANKVRSLTSEFNKEKNKLFSTNYDVYALAPIVGFIYGRKAKCDNGKLTTKIFSDKFIKEKHNLVFIFRLIMLLDKSYEPEAEKRIDNAFRLTDANIVLENELIFDEYVLGGVEVLYEKLMENISNEEDYLNNLYDFIEEFDDRYNKDVSIESILDLCSLARD